VASSAETEPASSDARLAIGVEMGVKHSTMRRRMETVVVAVVVAAAAAAEWQKVVEDQPEPCPFPNHLRLDSYMGHRCLFELGRTNYRERRMPAPECGRSSNQGCGVSEGRGQATSP